MKHLKQRLKKEAESFDKIAKERKKHNQIPDISTEFTNEYFYDNIWRNSLFVRAEYGSRCNWVIDAVKKAGVRSVLELGCGNGWLSLELARHGLQVTGWDISRESIKIAQNYFDSLEEKKNLSLRYECKNVLDFDGYLGQTVVCFGFLHHVPRQLLRRLMSYLSKNMKPGQLLVVVEPRYDHVSYEMATLVYAMRLALPNHFRYKNIKRNAPSHIKEIFNELSETRRSQSELDNISPSDFILKTIKDNFAKVETGYSSSFFGDIIGSIRVSDEDTKILSKLLKQLDVMVAKYNCNFSRTIKIKAEKAK